MRYMLSYIILGLCLYSWCTMHYFNFIRLPNTLFLFLCHNNESHSENIPIFILNRNGYILFWSWHVLVLKTELRLLFELKFWGWNGVE